MGTGEFTGESTSTVDDKNRIVLPRKYRDAIDFEAEGRELYISLDPDGCLVICPRSEWRRRLAQLDQTPYAKERLRRFRRYIAAMTETSKCDKQGRLLLPSRLTNEVGIERDVVLVGNISVIEVWPKDKWHQRREEARREFSKDIEDIF